jgi:class 3 adenylate cyclase
MSRNQLAVVTGISRGCEGGLRLTPAALPRRHGLQDGDPPRYGRDREMSEETRVGGDELRAREGELRRLTFMYCDVVGSTELSSRLEPETYRELLRAYRDACRDIIETRFDGHILRIKGDGALSIFGFPAAHENDAERAVRAGLALVQTVRELPGASSTAGEPLELRVGIHHGPVYLDFDEDDIYGLAANVGSRLEAIADPGTVVVSDEVRQLVEDYFDLQAGEPQLVKGVTEPLIPFRVAGERAALVADTATPLVEREDELVMLRQTWALVAAGDRARAAAILIRGDAGVGKSRLVAALDDEVCQGEACFIALHGSPFHVDAGFHPLRRLVESRCGIRNDANPRMRLECLSTQLSDVGLDPPLTIPFLAPILGIDPGAGYEPATAEGSKLEDQVSHAALDYVVGCTRGEHAILVAEDFHWFDDATRELLAELMRRGPGNLLIVATSRTPEPGAWETIELRPLTFGGRLELIDSLESGLPQEERLALATRSDGIPLFLEELVRAGAATADPDATAPVPGSVPGALYELLVARLYATPDALPVAATAAAAGQEVDRSLLAEAMSIPAQELAPTLRDLVEAQIMRPVAGHAARYRFRHELLREVAYELRPPSWRRKVHSRLADLLSREEVSDWRVLASHFELAERFREGAEAYERTAEGARRRGALSEARAHLTRAVDLVEHVAHEDGRDPLEVGIRLRRGFLAMLAEGVADLEASADFDRCLELAASDPRGENMVSALAALWARAVSRGELRRARQISETLYASLDARTEYLRAEVLHGFGLLDWFAGSFDSAIETILGCTQDLDRIEREHQEETFWFTTGHPTLHMRAHLAIALFMRGDSAEADKPLHGAIAAGDAMDFPRGPWSANYARWLGSWMWMEEERFDLAGEALAGLHGSSARHGFDNWELVAATQDAALDGLRALKSMPSDATALADHAEVLGAFIELWQALGLRVLLPFSITTQGALLAAAGDGEGARMRYDESLALAGETGMRFYDAETMRRIAHLAPDRDQAVSELGAALELARAQGARPFESRIARDLQELGN